MFKVCQVLVSFEWYTKRGKFPFQGPWQGNPLSLFLFLLCSGGLSTPLLLACQEGLVKRAKESHSGPIVWYLFFANGSLIFGDASLKGAINVKNALKEYEICSRQLINFNKFLVYFSSNVSEGNKQLIEKELGVRSSIDPDKYLGLLMVVGRNRKLAFRNIVDKIQGKINGWCNRWLSQGGKKIEAILCRYWWQKSQSNCGIHWCSCERLCNLKEGGELGFRKLTKFNFHYWPNKARVLKVKQYRRSKFLKVELGSQPSAIWRSIWAAKGSC
ncbi:reverse transcriptase [Gossypium australe]|uniref:Reverse transcriptase n=1 Tax=Gossypium australe TaxID=47621 RepID=A0A5B6VZB7_9ROSI|nr:reverse transcriptase [Gossypium australe]